MIPKVKEWIVRTDAAETVGAATSSPSLWRVLAPTRRLALMNLRHYGVYAAITSIGVARKPIGTHEMVTWEGGA